MAEAIRTISVTPFTYCYRWRKEFGGLKTDQVERLKVLEKQKERRRKAVSVLTLERPILQEGATPQCRSGGSSQCANERAITVQTGPSHV